MKSFKKIVVVIFFLCISISLPAQEGNTVKMADLMRSNGRIYVVVAVMLTILTGLVMYLVRLDKKIKKLENQIQE